MKFWTGLYYRVYYMYKKSTRKH